MEEANQPLNPIDMGNEDVKRRKKKKIQLLKYTLLTIVSKISLFELHIFLQGHHIILVNSKLSIQDTRHCFYYDINSRFEIITDQRYYELVSVTLST